MKHIKRAEKGLKMRNRGNGNFKSEMEDFRLKIRSIFSRIKGVFYALRMQGKTLATGGKLMLVLGRFF